MRDVHGPESRAAERRVLSWFRAWLWVLVWSAFCVTVEPSLKRGGVAGGVSTAAKDGIGQAEVQPQYELSLQQSRLGGRDNGGSVGPSPTPTTEYMGDLPSAGAQVESAPRSHSQDMLRSTQYSPNSEEHDRSSGTAQQRREPNGPINDRNPINTAPSKPHPSADAESTDRTEGLDDSHDHHDSACHPCAQQTAVSSSSSSYLRNEDTTRDDDGFPNLPSILIPGTPRTGGAWVQKREALERQAERVRAMAAAKKAKAEAAAAAAAERDGGRSAVSVGLGRGGVVGGTERRVGLALEPPVLVFRDSPLCIPRSAEVVLRNRASMQSCTDSGCSSNAPPSASTKDAAFAGEGYGGGDVRPAGSLGGRGVGKGIGEGWVQVISVTSDNDQFHLASFQTQALPPDGETSFKVTFLPRAAGTVEATLTVATSVGSIRYSVQANAVQNTYKIQPVVASGIPAGSTYTRPIIVYNPRDAPTLVISEIFATEGFIHLTIPDDFLGPDQSKGRAGNSRETASAEERASLGTAPIMTAFVDTESEGTEQMSSFIAYLVKSYLRIQRAHACLGVLPPYEVDEGIYPTEASREHHSPRHIPPGMEIEVVRISFHAETAGNFQGYVHVRTNRDSMVVPVDLQVARGGVNPTPHVVDFGVLTSPSERRQASVSLFNSGTEPMLIVGARLSHPDPRLNVGFREGTVIGAGEGMDDAVRLVYSGGALTPDSASTPLASALHAAGQVVIVMNHTNPDLSEVQIGYRAHVLHGGVAYEWDQVSFQVPVRNRFSKPPWPRRSGTTNDAPHGGDERVWGRPVAGGAAEKEEGGSREGDDAADLGPLVALETRRLALKNHFPVPMRLVSVTLEDCQDILSITEVDPKSAESVASPQGEWSGISLSFDRAAAVRNKYDPHKLAAGQRQQQQHHHHHHYHYQHHHYHHDHHNQATATSSPPPHAQHPYQRQTPPSLSPEAVSAAINAARKSREGLGEGAAAVEGSPRPAPEAGGWGSDGAGGGGDRNGRGAEHTPSVSTPDDVGDFSYLRRTQAISNADRGRGGELDGEGEGEVRWRDSSKSGWVGGAVGGRGAGDSDGSSGGERVGLELFSWQQLNARSMEWFPERSAPFMCALRAETNASIHHIPIFVFDHSLHFSLKSDSDGDGDGAEAGLGGGGGRAGRRGKVGGTGTEWPPPMEGEVRITSPTAEVAGLGMDARSITLWRPSFVSPGVATTAPPQTAGAAINLTPYETPPLVVDLGIVRAGTTARRRFHVTNLNPVEVNVTEGSHGGGLPFASLTLIGMSPLASAPQALSEIGHHMETRSVQRNVTGTTTSAGTRGSNPSSKSRKATAVWGTGSSHEYELVRETVSGVTITQTETLRVDAPTAGHASGTDGSSSSSSSRSSSTSSSGSSSGSSSSSRNSNRKADGMRWKKRRSSGDGGNSEDVDGDGSAQVYTLVPGARATFEIAATAPESVRDGSTIIQVRGLVLSTPVEAVPILVVYNTVRGGVAFHAPPRTPNSAAEKVPVSDGSSAESDRLLAGNAKGGGGGGGGGGRSQRRYDSDHRDNGHDEAEQQQRPQKTAEISEQFFPVGDDLAAGERQRQRSHLDEAQHRQEGWMGGFQEEEDERDGVAVRLHLDNAYPGKLAISPVSLVSTAEAVASVQRMESSGPLVQATLTRRDVPGVGVSTTDDVEAFRGRVLGGGPVEVGYVMYDASLHCADAWRCLAERAEQLSGIDRRRGWGAGEGGNRVGGASGDGGADDFLGSARAMEDVHDIIPRLVAQVHGDANTDPRQHQPQDNLFHFDLGKATSVNAGGGIDSGFAMSKSYSNRCPQADEDHLVALNSDGPAGRSSSGVHCRARSRQFNRGRSAHGEGGSESRVGASWREAPAADVGEIAARAAKELWRLWPDIVSAGINSFREEVTVKSSLGPAEAPLSVFVSLVVPRLVLGKTHKPAFATIHDEDDNSVALAAASSARKARALAGAGGDGIPLRFPITQVGETQEMYIEVCNPSDVSVSLELAAAERESVVWTPPVGYTGPGNSAGQTAAALSSACTISNNHVVGMPSPGGGVATAPVAVGGEQTSGREGPLTAFHVRVNGLGPVVLPPGESAVMGPVRFAPARAGLFSAHVYLRNNLTHLEPVCLEGEAGTGLLTIRPWTESGGQEGEKVAVGLGSSKSVEVEAGAGAGAASGQEVKSHSYDGGLRMMREEEIMTMDDDEVTRFAVDFRSWVRSPPRTEPVVKKWVLSNDGTMPLIVERVGIRKAGGRVGGTRWGNSSGRGNRSSGECSRETAGCSIGTWLWSLFFGNSARRKVAASARWGGAAAAAAAFAGVTTRALCAEGGFRVHGGRCADGGRWQAQTLQPGEEMEVAVDYSATHCNPVGRALDIVSSAGNTSIMMLAAASGGPSAAAACRSARRAAAAAGKQRSGSEWGKVGDRGRSSDGNGGGRGWEREGRWGRAWLLVKMAVLAGTAYVGYVLLGTGPQLPWVATWTTRLRTRAVGYFSSQGFYGKFGALAEVVVTSPTGASSTSSTCSTPTSFVGLNSAANSRGGQTSKPSGGAGKRKGAKGVNKGSNHQDASKKRGGDGGYRSGRHGAPTQAVELPTAAFPASDKQTKTFVDDSVPNGEKPVAVADVPIPLQEAGGATNEVGGSEPRTALEAVIASLMPIEVITSPVQAHKPTSVHLREDCLPLGNAEQARQAVCTGRGAVSQSAAQASSDGKRNVVSASPRLVPSRPKYRPTGMAIPKSGEIVPVARGSGKLRADAAAFCGPNFAQRNKGRGQYAQPPGISTGGSASYSGRTNGNGVHSISRGPPYTHYQQHSRHAPAGGTHQMHYSQGFPRNHQPLRGGTVPAGLISGSLPAVPIERGVSPSSSCSSSLVDSPSPPALASPAASKLASPEGGRHNGQHQRRHLSGGRQTFDAHHLNGHGSTYATPSQPGQPLRRDFRLGSDGTDGAAGAAAVGIGSTTPSFFRWGQPDGLSSEAHPRQPSLPPRTVTNNASRSGLPAAIPARNQHPLQRPTSGWLAGNSNSIPHGMPERTEAPPSTAAGSGSGAPSPIIAHASPPFGPIGSNRVSSRADAHPHAHPNQSPVLMPIGASRQLPLGLAPPPGLSKSGPSYSADDVVVSSAEAEWNDNLDTFVTASAVAAGVLGGDDEAGAAATVGQGGASGGGGWELVRTTPTLYDDLLHHQQQRHNRALSAPSAAYPASPSHASRLPQAYDNNPYVVPGHSTSGEHNVRSGSGAICVGGLRALGARREGLRFGVTAVDKLFAGENKTAMTNVHMQQHSGRAPTDVIGTTMTASQANARVNGVGSRLGYYMLSTGGVDGSLCNNAYGNAACVGGMAADGKVDEMMEESFMPVDPPVFLRGSSLSSLESSGAAGRNNDTTCGGDFFGFMGDDDDCSNSDHVE